MQGAVRHATLVMVLGLAVSAMAARASAQEPVIRREIRGFDFSPGGVWRQRARRVGALRAAALSAGRFSQLNAPLTGGVSSSSMVIGGLLHLPVILIRYRNSPDSSALFARAMYDQVLFGATPPAGRPYTLRTYYEEISRGQLSVRGQAFGWVTADSNDTWYEGTPQCNGIFCGSRPVGRLLLEALQKTDATIDFGQFDNDGDDGVPNSGDDDGVVDLVLFVHAEIGGECGPTSTNNNLWAHRFVMAAVGGQFTTNDARAGSGFIRVNDYTVQSGVGGQTCNDAAAPMPVGTVAHETGHGFGLPDFYDTDPSDEDNSEGIGDWGLMGSGNYTRPYSPSHMESFSLAQLGWIAVRPLTANGTYTIAPIETGDTAYLVRPPASVPNPRGEYFLIENRQPLLADSAMFRIARRNGVGGLMIWHVDSTKYFPSATSNRVNTGPIHGLWLMQADGQNALRSSTVGIRNRGDSTDLFPGPAQNTAFGIVTNPSVTLNTTGRPFAGMVVDSIRQLAPNGDMSFRLRFGAVTTVRAADTTAQIRVRGTAFPVYRDLFGAGDTATVSVDPFQTANGGRSEFTFVSWSDGGARTHVFTAAAAGGTLTASVSARHKVAASTVGAGTVAAAPAADLSAGTFFNGGDTVRLTATPGPGQGFAGWTGDTIALNPSLLLRVNHPFAVTATFQSAIVVIDSALRAPVVGAPYADTVVANGGNGSFSFTVVAGRLPTGLALNFGGVISGTATRDSAYDFTVRILSGGQILDVPMRLAPVAPTLTLQAVVDHYLGTAGALTDDQVRFLDLTGNGNGRLDVGDLASWLDRTGQAVSAATMTRILRRTR